MALSEVFEIKMRCPDCYDIIDEDDGQPDFAQEYEPVEPNIYDELAAAEEDEAED